MLIAIISRSLKSEVNLIFSHNFCIFPKFLILNIFYNLKDLSENTANIKETHCIICVGKEREGGRENFFLLIDNWHLWIRTHSNVSGWCLRSGGWNIAAMWERWSASVISPCLQNTKFPPGSFIPSCGS